MKKILSTALVLISIIKGSAQSSPNMGDGTPATGNTTAASKFMGGQVNLFTGQPSIAVPLFSYASNNGIGVNVGLNYTGAGGIKLNEPASAVGLGWYLNCGGSITRIIRGTPDDLPQRGFLYTAAIPSDFRANADKYHYDTLDSQQDVFQFNFNGNNGKFYIRKNKQVILVPFSKLKVQPVFNPNPAIGTILSFIITTEDGVCYIFKDGETASHSSAQMHQGYSSVYTSWNLTQIISPFGADTIRFTYSGASFSGAYGYPLIYLMAPPYTLIYKAYNFTGNQTWGVKKIQSIVLPDKRTVSFTYSKIFFYEEGNTVLEKIIISDSIFRSGFILNYTDTANSVFLTGIIPYTAKERTRGYRFEYDWSKTGTVPFVRNDMLREPGIISTNVDDMGFDLGRTTNLKSSFVYTNYPSGIWQDRSPNLAQTKKGVLSRMINPEGASTEYEYELNEKNPAGLSYKYYSVAANAIVTNSITLKNTYLDGHILTFKPDTSLLRTQSPPLSGTCNLLCKIKTSAGAASAVDSVTISLYDLYYNGLKKWKINIPDGNYVMETRLSGGGTVSPVFNVYISWYNHDYIAETLPLSGLRIKQVKYKNDVGDTEAVAVQSYRYVLEDGESSGMIGEIPLSSYDYRETFVNNSTLAVRQRKFYLALSQQPMNVLDFSQGSIVGYTRVEVINGTTQQNIGKEVHEFTSLKQSGNSSYIPVFPFAPNDLNEWAVGLPLSVKVYNNAGTLQKKTLYQYDIKITSYKSVDDRSIKLGLAQNITFENALNQALFKKNVYVAEDYYPQSGRVFQTAVYDTTYNENGSILTSKTQMEYDTTRFLIKKVIKPYDRSRGLNLEKRFYYPQDYTITGVIGKLRDSGIITPVIATEEWITGDASPRILSGAINEPQQLPNGCIRPYRSYMLETNKPLLAATIGNFNPAQLNRNSTYFKQQVEFPAYDSRGNLLQIKNSVSGLSASMIIDYANLYKTADVSHAVKSDIAYTSFESDGNGNWSVGSTTRTYSYAYSGKKSYSLASGNVVKTFLSSSQNYLVTVWARSGATININGAAIGNAVTNYNGWYLYSKAVTGITQITVSGSGTIDELRLHPADANMITYAYEPTVGVIASVDANNTVIYNEYDNLNRLKVVRDRNRNVVQKYEYTDSVYIISMLPVWTGTGYACTGDARYDSVYTDTNPYSPTHGNNQYVTPEHYGECLCMPVDYKCVYGVAEKGVRVNKSTRKVTIGVTNYWECTFYYMWSDCSKSQDYTELNSSACTTQPGNCF